MASEQPRFSERLSMWQSPRAHWNVIVSVLVLLGGFAVLVIGLIQNIPGRGGVFWLAVWLLLMGGFFGAFLLFVPSYFRKYILEVHDDGIYYRSPREIKMNHIPIEQITNVEWDDRPSSNSHIFTQDEEQEILQEWKEEDWGRGPSVTHHACVPISKGPQYAIGDGVVRVDTDEEWMPYLFGTDHPKRLADTIETASDQPT